MKRLLCISIISTMLLGLLAGCGQQTIEEPPVLEPDEIVSMTDDVAVENTQTEISQKKTDMSDKAVEMETVALVNEELYRDAYYGVPVKIGANYYKIPALKILNYYFLDLNTVNKITNISFNVTEKGIDVNAPENVKINTDSLDLGSISAEAIDISEIKLITDEEKLAVNYKNKNYISLITLDTYMPSEKFYVDSSIGAITNIKPNIEHPSVNESGLLRKTITIDDTKELVVREGTYGKMLVVYDVYGSSLDITPDNITFATDLQNIFLHKTDNVIYMFGLMGNSIEVYTITIDESLNISIASVGSIQRTAQNIYFLDGKYIAVGREDVFGINIGEDSVNEVNMSSLIEISETGGDFNVIDNVYYLSVKNQFGVITIYSLNIADFKLEEVSKLELPIEIDAAKKNFYYSFVEDNMISIYLMDNTGYIYNVTYNPETNETETYQTDTFRLFYSEEKYPIEFAINLVKANETGDSELSLTVNNKYLGNNIIIYGTEDNWVYCTEYIENEDAYSVYSFRYNAITGIRDYANLA